MNLFKKIFKKKNLEEVRIKDKGNDTLKKTSKTVSTKTIVKRFKVTQKYIDTMISKDLIKRGDRKNFELSPSFIRKLIQKGFIIENENNKPYLRSAWRHFKSYN